MGKHTCAAPLLSMVLAGCSSGLIPSFLRSNSAVEQQPEDQQVHEYQGIKIIGPAEYAARMEAAIDCVQKDPDSWDLVRRNIECIKLTGHSGIDPETGLFSTSSYETYKKEQIAGCIVHDADHRSLYREGKPYCGETAERSCLERQNKFFEAIGFPEIDIEKTVKTEY